MKKTLLALIFLSCFTFLHAAGELFDFYIPSQYNNKEIFNK